MHHHIMIRDIDLSCVGVWEDKGEIVGVVHPEHTMGTAYFEFHPAHPELRSAMLEHAEERIGICRDEVRSLAVHIHDDDLGFQKVASGRGYKKTEMTDPMLRLDISGDLPDAPLPSGFKLKSLTEDNSYRKIDRCCWRGFNHKGEPPDDGPEGRAFMQSAPGFRRDLNIVAEAPGGSFVSYCGMWYEPKNAFAYVEPVCTDPDYRRLGLARACLLEGARRCADLGATVAYVGSTIPLYRSIGFKLAYQTYVWKREWA
jgi:GNAT superfamily N-acetyltransferase